MPMKGEPLYDLMLLYGQLGVKEWQKEDSALRLRAQTMLGLGIADKDDEVEATLDAQFHEGDPEYRGKRRFVPMPWPKNKQFERAFFVPIRPTATAGNQNQGYELYLLIDGPNWLAFRYEGPEGNGPHKYGHVQMCQQLLRKKGKPLQPLQPWIPVSYPAHPVPASDSLGLFLTMLVALHGYQGGRACQALILELFQQVSAPSASDTYNKLLAAMLAT